MFKIRDKVETPLGVGIVGVLPNDENKFYTIDLISSPNFEYYFNEFELKPYKSAHEKLLELGYSFKDNGYALYYELDKSYITIDEKWKTFEITSETGYSLEVDLELSKILTQRLEETE